MASFSNSALANPQTHATAPTHCVFRSGTSWLALPATVVREVMSRPDMTSIPGTPATFHGLCHVRSEFIPVLNLKSLMCESDPTDSQILLILENADGAWAVLVDEVIALQRLEASDAPATDESDGDNLIAGWATSGEHVIQILDPFRIGRMARQQLIAQWQSENPMQHNMKTM